MSKAEVTWKTKFQLCSVKTDKNQILDDNIIHFPKAVVELSVETPSKQKLIIADLRSVYSFTLQGNVCKLGPFTVTPTLFYISVS